MTKRHLYVVQTKIFLGKFALITKPVSQISMLLLLHYQVNVKQSAVCEVSDNITCI